MAPRPSAPSTRTRPASSSSTATDTIILDTIAPTVTSITRTFGKLASADSVEYTVTFSEPVSGVSTGIFSLTSGAGATLSGTTVSTVSGTAPTTTWLVDADTGTGDGTLRLDQSSSGAVIDAAGNVLSGTFTTGQFFTIDRTRPTSTIAFPANGGLYRSATWSGSLTGTAADPTAGNVKPGVSAVLYSVQQGSGLYWVGSGFNSASPIGFGANFSAGNWSASFPLSNFPADGSYTVRWSSLDNAGNFQSPQTSSTFTIDTTDAAGSITNQRQRPRTRTRPRSRSTSSATDTNGIVSYRVDEASDCRARHSSRRSPRSALTAQMWVSR